LFRKTFDTVTSEIPRSSAMSLSRIGIGKRSL
jgi:hypothetical protein